MSHDVADPYECRCVVGVANGALNLSYRSPYHAGYWRARREGLPKCKRNLPKRLGLLKVRIAVQTSVLSCAQTKKREYSRTLRISARSAQLTLSSDVFEPGKL